VHSTATVVITHIAVGKHRIAIIAIRQRIGIEDDTVGVGDHAFTATCQIIVVGHVVGEHDVEEGSIAEFPGFNNYIDPDLFGGSGSIDDNGGGNSGVIYTNHFYNNIAVNCTSAFPASSIANGGNNAILLEPTAGDDPVDRNITYMVTSNPACGGPARGSVDGNSVGFTYAAPMQGRPGCDRELPEGAPGQTGKQ
jgi:hypothetical protein